MTGGVQSVFVFLSFPHKRLSCCESCLKCIRLRNVRPPVNEVNIFAVSFFMNASVLFAETSHRKDYMAIVETEQKDRPGVQGFEKIIILCPRSCRIDSKDPSRSCKRPPVKASKCPVVTTI